MLAQRSPDLIPLDYLWGYMKSLVYDVNASTTDKLLKCIMDASMQIINNKTSLMRSITSFPAVTDLCKIREVISSNYFISTSIGN